MVHNRLHIRYVPTATCIGTKLPSSGSLLTTERYVQHALQAPVALTSIIKIKTLNC